MRLVFDDTECPMELNKKSMGQVAKKKFLSELDATDLSNLNIRNRILAEANSVKKSKVKNASIKFIGKKLLLKILSVLEIFSSI